MIHGVRAAIRYGRSWTSVSPRVKPAEASVVADGERLPGSLYLPPVRPDGLSAWIVLHGVTRLGLHHPSLVRFARAVASTPALVLVPEIPEWTQLSLAPERTFSVIRGALKTLTELPGVVPERVGLIGFSFGAPLAVLASTRPDISPHLRRVVGFGGYCDLERTLRFQFTGVHRWRGRTYTVTPDPYGRWIVGGNFLTKAPGHEESGDVADALLELARESGDLQIDGSEPSFDSLKARLRKTIAPQRKELYDFFAPPAGQVSAAPEVEQLIEVLCPTVRRVCPLMDPLPHIDTLPVPVLLIHGRQDTLIPFSETLAFRSALSGRGRVSAKLTGLFAHSAGNMPRGPIVRFLEGVQFLDVLRRVFKDL